jgi:hypothetical protein
VSIGLFVDGGATRGFFGTIDFAAVRRHVERELRDKVAEATYFDGERDPPSPASAKFHKYLAAPPPFGAGYHVRLYPIIKKRVLWPDTGIDVKRPDGRTLELEKQVGVDVGLALRMMASHRERGWDKLALLCSDGDLHEPVAALKRAGVKFCLLHLNGQPAWTLLKEADERINLCEDPARMFVYRSRVVKCYDINNESEEEGVQANG